MTDSGQIRRFSGVSEVRRCSAEASLEYKWNTLDLHWTTFSLALRKKVVFAESGRALTEKRPVVKHVVNPVAGLHVVVLHAAAGTWMMKHGAQSGHESLFTLQLLAQK